MSVSTIASLILTLLKLGLSWFEKHREDLQQQAGADRERLKALESLNAISSTLREIDERYAKMSDDEIKADIEKQGDFRD